MVSARYGKRHEAWLRAKCARASPSRYYNNQLTFRDINGNSIASYNGFQLYPPADGNQFLPSTNREFYFTFDAADKIAQVDFQSFGNSFEFDNIYAAVPEPSVWLMLIAGFGLVGTMLRRRNAALAV